MQERVESDNTENFIVHAALDRFIINSHAFHNAHLLRATLPRDLPAPIPLFEDREEKHNEFAATLRANWASKADKRKAAAVEKRKSIPARKKKPRPLPTSDEDAITAGPSRKRRRTAVQHMPAAPSMQDGGMVASRAKRTVRPTERARALEEDSEGSEEGDEFSGDDSDMYNASSGDCSD